MNLSDNLKTYLLGLLNAVTLPVDQADLAVELKAFKDSLTNDVAIIQAQAEIAQAAQTTTEATTTATS